MPHAFAQINYLLYELNLIVNRRKWRWITCWFGGSAGVLASYRIDRFFYLLVGEWWALGRLLLFPFFVLLKLMSASHEINYKADIGKGLKILHPTLGIVITGYAIIGNHLTLVGGNCIGQRKALERGDLVLGDSVTLGANAVVLGPVRVGNNVTVGANAVVVQDADDNSVLIGVAARPLEKQ